MGMRHAARICTVNFVPAPSPMRSSMIPMAYIMMRLMTNMVVHMLSVMCWSERNEWTLTASRSVSIMLGRNVIPPSLGMALLCIFRELGMS